MLTISLDYGGMGMGMKEDAIFDFCGCTYVQCSTVI